MITFLSQKLRYFLLFMLALVAVSFVFFGNWTPSGPGSGPLGKINNQIITGPVLSNAFNGTQLVFTLRTGVPAEDMGAFSERIYRETWIRMAVVAAAREAGLEATPDMVARWLQELPLFAGPDGRYSAERFTQFKTAYLDPRSISEERLFEIVRDEILYETMMVSVANTAAVNPSESAKQFEQLFGTVSVSLINIPKLTDIPQPTPEELEAFYQANIAAYQIPEKRRIEYVSFDLTPEQQKLEGKEKLNALQAAGQKAFDFTAIYYGDNVAAVPPPFAERAAEFGQKVQSSPLISLSDTFIDQRITRVAFDLNKDAPISNYLQTENGFVVLNLVEIVPARAKPLAEITAEVQADWRKDQAERLTLAEAQRVRTQLLETLKTGVSWADAVKTLGLKTVEVPPFIPAEASDLKVANADVVLGTSRLLNPGELSEPQATGNGFALVYVIDRTPAAEEKRAEILPRLEDQLADLNRNRIITDWLSSLSRLPGNQLPENLLEEANQVARSGS